MRALIGIIVVAVAAAGCASSPGAREDKPEQIAEAEGGADAAVSLEEVPELPAYPGATRTKLETSTVPTAEWTRKAKVELEVRDSLENVKAFYEKAIRDHGWQVAGVREEGDKVGWKLVKAGAVAEIRIEREGRKRVEIRLERKDR
ncbi:MAG TPA: hypothetical protein P5234_01960 [Thermoanaerobaculaceae bacterium]|nr:hypothetical protein [Thermoanaerobaculaceae bacterium]HRS14993.1 hypothetical protein [Thermoanaerobaculaceae bacterium]